MLSGSQHSITLKGSTEIVCEFFDYAINSILYQRGIYPPDEFQQVKKYGMSILVTKDKGLREYLDNVLVQMNAWLMSGEVQKLVVVLSDARTNEPIERWNFDIERDNKMASTGSDKPVEEVSKEIAAIIRQITSSVSFLPLIDCPCTFDLLVYTDKNSETPVQWMESDPKYIKNAEEVKLRSFSTKIHKVESLVSYLVE